MKYSFNGKELDEAVLKQVAALNINKCVERVAIVEGATVNATIGFCVRPLAVPHAKFDEYRDAAEQQSFLHSDKHEVRVAPRIIVKDNISRFSEAVYESSLQIPNARLKAAILHNPSVLQNVPARLNITINPVNFKRNIIDESAINIISARGKNIRPEIRAEVRRILLEMIQESIEKMEQEQKNSLA